MTQHNATRRGGAGNDPGLPRWVWFVTGLVTGVFLSFIFYLHEFVDADPETAAITPGATLPGSRERTEDGEMQWKFYDLFPEAEVAINDNYATGEREFSGSYLLQAGSFRKQDEADRLRAELILMGLEVTIRKIKVNGQDWHRVMVGPLASDAAVTRAAERLAEIDIAAIPIRVKP